MIHNPPEELRTHDIHVGNVMACNSKSRERKQLHDTESAPVAKLVSQSEISTTGCLLHGRTCLASIETKYTDKLGKSPASRPAMRREIKTEGDDSRFALIVRGMFALNQ
jgi:hypothetical protein